MMNAALLKRLEELTNQLDNVTVAGERWDLIRGIEQDDLTEPLLRLLFRSLSTNAENCQWTFDETVILTIEMSDPPSRYAALFHEFEALLAVDQFGWSHLHYFLSKAADEEPEVVVSVFRSLDEATKQTVLRGLNQRFDALDSEDDDESAVLDLIRQLRETTSEPGSVEGGESRAVSRGGAFYVLEPEVAGHLGEQTIVDTTVHPPHVTRLHYEFDGWLGDDIVESFPCFVVTARLAGSTERLGAGGIVFDDVITSTSDTFRELDPTRRLPPFRWLRVTGVAGVDDFGLSGAFQLVVAERILDLWKRHFNLVHCGISRLRA